MGDETAHEALKEAVASCGGGSLRDLVVFDRGSFEVLYQRSDVADTLADVDLGQYVDNERYGYVIRDTYNDLSHAEYAYTVRGFDAFEQFRTFVRADDGRVGVIASFDRSPDGGGRNCDFGELQAAVESVADTHGSRLGPRTAKET